MNWYQMGLYKEDEPKGHRLHQQLLAKGEKPDMRPWGGRFDIDLPNMPTQCKTDCGGE